MNRQGLFWFAAGAATTATAAIIGAIAIPNDEPAIPMLRVLEPSELYSSREQMQAVGSFGGQMLRRCGASNFTLSALGVDIEAFAFLPLTKDNEQAFQCVLRAVENEGFQVDIVFRNPNMQAQW